jgi:hypothetical protein
MTSTSIGKLIVCFVLTAICCNVKPAAAEIQNCTNITSIPAVITTQGVYCLKQHVTASLASGAAIQVMTNNVTIDCNDFKVGNLAAGPANTATGISAQGRLNVEVHHCSVRGFERGIQFTNGLYVVEDSRFDNNSDVGIYVGGDGSAVRRNEVVDTGGDTNPSIHDFVAIHTDGDADIIDNLINGVVATRGGDGTTYGILADNMDSGLISGNRVRNLVPDGSGHRRGIWNMDGNRTTVEGNTVVFNSTSGLLGSLLTILNSDAGIVCGNSLLKGASRDNTVLGTGTLGEVLGLVNCVQAGGNYVNPL